MSNEVGFSFQADVVNTASFAHMLTGRVLKALSDGGVDKYAVTAAFWMGVKVPIRSSLADTVHAHISKRPNYQSVLSKALNIGWGHSTLVVEMTRTRAGTNGLLLVGAFATGVSAFQAAETLSELLEIYDMDVSMLPSVDVLEGLVKYLAPFVHDLGFSKVLQHITYVCEGAIEAQDCDERTAIRERGSPNVLAAAVKQLIYTSQMRQDHFMLLKVRGSWLPAFASHLLGMSVELRYRDKIVWASGGDNRSVVFQLFDHMEQHPIQQLPKSLTIVERAYGGYRGPGIDIDCSLGDALDSQCARWPEIDVDIAASIHAAVRRLSFDLPSRNHVYSAIEGSQDSWKFPHTRHRPMHAVDDVKALELVLEAMNVRSQPAQSMGLLHRKVQLPTQKYLSTRFNSKCAEPATFGIGVMERKCVGRMASRCHRHQAVSHSVAEDTKTSWLDDTFDPCLCQRIGRLIYGCAIMAWSLARCNFNASHLRVQESVMNGETRTNWGDSFVEYDDGYLPKWAPYNSHLAYLAQLLCSDYDRSWTGATGSILGLSGGAYTIYYTCLMENDCYDDFGRMISIRTGRASVAGSFRNTISEPSLSSDYGKYGESLIEYESDAMDDLDLTWLTGKCLLEPHRRPPRSDAFIHVTLQESAISVELRCTSKTGNVFGWNFTDCIWTFLTLWLVPRCKHSRDSVYEVPTDHVVGVGGFDLEEYMYKHSRGKVALFALKGNKLEQLLTCGVGHDKSETETRDGSKRYGVLQLHACLKCCIKLAQNSELCHPYVVMGG